MGSAGVVCPWPGEVLKGRVLSKVALCHKWLHRGLMASADVVSAVATLLEDYDIYSVEDLADLIVDPAVAADIAGRL